MKLLLVYHDQKLGSAWAEYFSDQPAVSLVQGDICKVPCDAIVSPANSFGFMDGGLDYQLSERFGWNLQVRLQQVIREKYHGELLVGQAEIIPTGDAEVPWLISAPTMRVPMHVKATINAYLAMRAILLAVSQHSAQPSIDTVAVPGLGTGVGDLRHDIAARQMWAAYEEVVMEKARFPQDLGQAVDAHLKLNPLGMLYD